MSLTIISSNGLRWYNSTPEVEKKSGIRCATTSSTNEGAPKKTRSAAKLHSKIKYEAFDFLSKYSTCPFWTDLFLDIASENLKKGFRFYPKTANSFDGGRLIHRVKLKENICNIPEITEYTAERVHSTIKQFIISKIGILSEQDRIELEITLLQQNATTCTTEESNWAKIRGNTKKFQMIFTYVYSVFSAKHRGLRKYLNKVENIINLGIISGVISPCDIELEDGAITHINGIIIDETTNKVSLEQTSSINQKNMVKICNTLYPQTSCVTKKSNLEKMIRKLSTQCLK